MIKLMMTTGEAKLILELVRQEKIFRVDLKEDLQLLTSIESGIMDAANRSPHPNAKELLDIGPGPKISVPGGNKASVC